MDINQKNTQILCKCMSEMDEPSTIHKIAQHAISRMNIVIPLKFSKRFQ